MPNYHFREINTPLKIFQIRFFRDDEKRIWIKVRDNKRRLLRGNRSSAHSTDRQ